MSAETIIRLVVLVVTLANAFLSAIGKNPLPFSSDEAYVFISALAATGATVWATWKNNSITQEAKTGDKIMVALKNGETTLEEVNEFLETITKK